MHRSPGQLEECIIQRSCTAWQRLCGQEVDCTWLLLCCWLPSKSRDGACFLTIDHANVVAIQLVKRSQPGSPCIFAVNNLTTEHRFAFECDPHMVFLSMRLTGTACGGLLPRVIIDLVTNKIVICPDGSSQRCLASCTRHSNMPLPLYCCVVQRSESTKLAVLMWRQNQ